MSEYEYLYIYEEPEVQQEIKQEEKKIINIDINISEIKDIKNYIES